MLLPHVALKNLMVDTERIQYNTQYHRAVQTSQHHTDTCDTNTSNTFKMVSSHWMKVLSGSVSLSLTVK